MSVGKKPQPVRWKTIHPEYSALHVDTMSMAVGDCWEDFLPLSLFFSRRLLSVVVGFCHVRFTRDLLVS